MICSRLIPTFLVFVSFISCSPEDDIKTPDLIPYLFYEEFLSNSTDGEDIVMEGWTNYAQTGTMKWKQGLFGGKKYAEFTSYQSGEISNVAWLISPKINMDNFENEKLVFDVAQAYVTSSANSIELFISTNYDGANVLDANWQSIPFTKPPLNNDTNFDFFSSGVIDLSSYTGTISLAFKAVGSGSNASLNGTYEIDNIRIFDKE